MIIKMKKYSYLIYYKTYSFPPSIEGNYSITIDRPIKLEDIDMVYKKIHEDNGYLKMSIAIKNIIPMTVEGE